MRRTSTHTPTTTTTTTTTTSAQRFSQASQPWRARTSNKRKKKQQTQTIPAKPRRRKTKGAKSAGGKATVASPNPVECLQSALANLKDPRVNRQRRHLLLDIVIIAVCAVIAGGETWKDMAIWGQSHLPWLKRFLPLPNGVPSRDTFRRVISRLDEQQFQSGFTRWMAGLARATKGRLIAFDGKTARGSKGRTEIGSPLHIVSAWASEQHLTLGQVTVDSKSNEITAIPELLALLDLHGALVTIDALGCQKQIARQIIDQQGDYCLAVKENQPHLYEDLEDHFQKCVVGISKKVEVEYHDTSERAHGHTDERAYFTTPVPENLRHREEWPGIQSVGMTMTHQNVENKAEGEVRYYILSIPSDAEKFAAAVRGHWGIENSLHWVMDVTFREDACRIGKDHGGENVSWLRRFAISLLKNEPSVKDTIRAKRNRAGWDIQYLETVLAAAIQKDQENPEN